MEKPDAALLPQNLEAEQALLGAILAITKLLSVFPNF